MKTQVQFETLRATLFLILFSFSASVWALGQNGPQNQFDDAGRKTGYWQVKGNMQDKPGYAPDAIFEEGSYANGKKQGLWKRYYPNGKLKSEINYSNDKPSGPYKTFYENGNLEEEATWTSTASIGKQTGSFKRYHPNGTIHQSFYYADNGLKTGEQKVYHENGQEALVYNMIDGREEGLIKYFDEKGKLTKQKEMTGGTLVKDSIKDFTPTFSEPIIPLADKTKKPEPVADSSPNEAQLFRPNGYNILYNNDNLKVKKGDFKNGQLWDGEDYKYNKNGLLKKVEVYKGGKYVGNRSLTEEEKR